MSRAIGVIGVTGQVGRLLTEEIPKAGAALSGAVGFGSIRAGEIVGETSIYFMSDDETVILGRRVFDRRVYAEGAVQAALWAIGRKPGLYAMKDVLAKSR